MTRADAGAVLRRSLLVWGLGHAALGATAAARLLIAAELVALGIVAWLTLGLADTSAYLVPFLAGVLFLVAWGWQSVDAYRLARRREPARSSAGAEAPARSEAVAIGWLAVPLLVWGAGFWLVGAERATPAAVLDEFVAAWTTDELEGGSWDVGVVREARRAVDEIGTGADRFRDIRVRILTEEGRSATAVAEAVHYERRSTSFLGVFPGSELVPVADDEILRLDLAAEEAPLPGGGEIGAVRWSVVGADARP